MATPVVGTSGPADLRATHPAPGVCVVSVLCELDMLSAPRLRRLLTGELAHGYRLLVINFAGCEFMGSSGLAALLAARDQATTTNTRLALARLTRTVNRSLHATALDTLFDIYPTVDAALTSG